MTLTTHLNCQHKNHEAHFVHFYHDDRYLTGALHEFIKLGIEKNEGIIIIATDKHIEAIKKELPLHKPMQVIFVDANLALTKIMTNEFINKNKFQEFVGTIVTEMRSRYKNLRFFGEIVDVLCSIGMSEEALELEGYWNELLNAETGISLMCGYSAQNVKNYNNTDRISHTHSFVVSKGKDDAKDVGALYSRIAALEMRVANYKLNERNFEKMEKEVTVLKKQITHSTKLSLLGEITTNLAHELLNPLTIIGSYTSVVKSVLKDETFKGKEFTAKQVEGIDKTVTRMSDLMKSILVLANNSDPKFVNYSVSDSVLTAIELMGPHLKSKNIKLIHNASTEELTSIGDNGQMIQVFLNLLTNSRDAIEEAHGPRGGTITITEKRLSNNSIEISVDDNGIGMKKAIQENIFKTFFTTKQSGKGTGLGLPIVQKTIKDFKGSIHCTSMHQQGTQIKIVVPGK